MSDINGEGYGDSHDWERRETFQWSYFGPKAFLLANTYFRCRKCREGFYHSYHLEKDIFKAMEKSGVPDQCIGESNELATSSS